MSISSHPSTIIRAHSTGVTISILLSDYSLILSGFISLFVYRNYHYYVVQ